MDRPSDTPPIAPNTQGPTWLSPVVILSFFWISGVALGLTTGWPDLWLTLTTFALMPAVIAVARQRWKAAGYWGLTAALFVAASWSALQEHCIARDDVARFVTANRQLAQVQGIIDDEPHTVITPRGHFARFMHLSPSTSFTLSVESIWVGDHPQPAGGKLSVRLHQADHRLCCGDRIRATGWLQPFRNPLNPGEFDYARYMARHGVRGQLLLDTRRNWTPIDRPLLSRPVARFCAWLGAQAMQSLHLGLEDNPERLAFLDTLLLGRRTGDLDRLEHDFRRTGLFHLLSVSGAHLGMLLGLTWLGTRLFLIRPQKAMGLVLLVLVTYLCLVPHRVPIIRASIMALLWCAGTMSGRLTRPVDCMALAAVAVLIWRPGDLFAADFQLSFGIVLALLTLTEPMSCVLWPDIDNPLQTHPYNPWRRTAQRFVLFLSANLVAFLVAAPLVAYHFQMLNPWSVAYSIITFPLALAVMGLGFIKIWLGMLLPSAGVLLAIPLRWTSDLFTNFVRTTAAWPSVSFDLASQPSLLWLISTLAVAVAICAGRFRHRPLPFTAAVGISVLWLGFNPSWITVFGSGSSVPLRLNMLAVGDGSCFVLRTNYSDSGKDHVLLFDCGSFGNPDVGSRTIVPALKSLGVSRVNTLILSHADIDHYNGCLAVADRISVDRVLTPPQMLAEAREQKYAAVAYLAAELQVRGIPIQTVQRGYSEPIGPARLDILWPPADLVAKRSNDTSIVASIRTDRARVLLNGDIQQQAITSLLESGVDLDADICDLPHHGSFVPASPRWIDAVSPKVVLQSTGRSRLGTKDKWADLVQQKKLDRLVSVQTGMVEVTIDDADQIRWSCFRESWVTDPQGR